MLKLFYSVARFIDFLATAPLTRCYLLGIAMLFLAMGTEHFVIPSADGLYDPELIEWIYVLSSTVFALPVLVTGLRGLARALHLMPPRIKTRVIPAQKVSRCRTEAVRRGARIR
jgi:hypothetical protein